MGLGKIGLAMDKSIQNRWTLWWTFVALIPLGIAITAFIGVMGAVFMFVGAIGALVVGYVIDQRAGPAPAPKKNVRLRVRPRPKETRRSRI
jgi:hypothetical protein